MISPAFVTALMGGGVNETESLGYCSRSGKNRGD
jgi:hypothetical protein